MSTHSGPRPTASIVVVGSVNIDLITRVARHPSPGETLHGTGGEMLPGGTGANQAVAAARMGGEVAMVGAVGTDAQAQVVLDALRETGVDVEAVREVEGPTGLAVVTVAEDGENTIVVVPGANGTVDAARVHEHEDVLAAAAIAVAQGEIPREGIEAIPGLVSGRFLHNPAPVIELDPAVLRASDPLVVNEHEAGLVLAQLEESDGAVPSDDATARGRRACPADTAGPADTADPADSSPEQLVTALRRAGIRSVVLTLGAQGALVSEEESGADIDTAGASGADVTVVRIPPAPVDAVDTTGAGDAFIGALAVGLARGEGLPTAARLASRVGAFAATGHGAQPSYPDLGSELPELADAG